MAYTTNNDLIIGNSWVKILDKKDGFAVANNHLAKFAFNDDTPSDDSGFIVPIRTIVRGDSDSVLWCKSLYKNEKIRVSVTEVN